MKSIKLLVAAAVTAALAVGMPVAASAAPAASGISADDKLARAEIVDGPSTRTNASGPKLASNTASTDPTGIYFIWDSKQKDAGYLKVAESVFETYDSFVLTIKEANKYFDFTIVVQDGQQPTADGNYIFLLPKVADEAKSINMVFLGSWKLKESDVIDVPGTPDVPDEPDDPATNITYSIGFIGYYVTNNGNVQTTTAGWRDLTKPGQCLTQSDIDAIYTDWTSLSGRLGYPGNGFTTSGIASRKYGNNDEICYNDMSDGLLAQESDATTYIVWADPGVAPIVLSFERYVRDVNKWNNLYNVVYASDGERQQALRDYGGMRHYLALMDYYKTIEGHTFFGFTLNPQEDYGYSYDFWSEQFEAGFNLVSQ